MYDEHRGTDTVKSAVLCKSTTKLYVTAVVLKNDYFIFKKKIWYFENKIFCILKIAILFLSTF